MSYSCHLHAVPPEYGTFWLLPVYIAVLHAPCVAEKDEGNREPVECGVEEGQNEVVEENGINKGV